MKKTIAQFISGILALTLALVSVYGVSASANNSPLEATKIYYVSPNGNDANAGTSNAPFKTLTKGVLALVAGDTLMVSGTFNETLKVSKSGTVDAPITIIGNKAVLDMKGSKANGILLSGSFINITGFEVKNTVSHGILIGGKNIRLENSSVHHSVMENGSGGNCTGTGGWGSGIKVMVGGQNVVIRGNSVYENCGEGIGITRGVNVLVENNVVRDNFSVNIYLDNSPYSTAQSNIVSCTGIYLRNGNRPSGIALAEESYSGWGAQRHHLRVLKNFVDGCYDGIASWEPEVAGGKLIDSEITDNTVVHGIRRSIYLNAVNQNVVVRDNVVFAAIVNKYPNSVTMSNNIVSNVAITSTPDFTTTVVPATITPTVNLPSTTVVSTLPATVTSVPKTATPIPNTATAYVTSQPTLISATPVTEPPAKEVIYDDTNANINYSTGWNTIIASGAYQGGYRATSSYGASITINFVGDSFSLLYTDGPSYRQMEVYVDGNLVKTLTRSTSKAKYQMRWDYPGVLSSEQHVVKLVFKNGNGTFDGFIVRPSFNAQLLTTFTSQKTPIIVASPTFTTTALPETPIVILSNTPATEDPTSLPSSTPEVNTTTPTP